MMPFNGYGSYLVRESESNPGECALSVRDREQVRHYKISKLTNGTFFINRHATFETILDLITHYRQQAGGLCTNLITPCALSEKPQTASLSRQADEEWEIDRRQIITVKKLMSNRFVEVWEGLWNETTPVAVRISRHGKISIHDFLQTANLMKKIEHQNIIQLYGVCTKEEPMYIITELMKHISLLDYLRGEGRSLNLPQLIDVASQVAAGMAYLEKRNIIHRNLAARSILVGEILICKIANFEMAKVIDENIYEAHTEITFAIKWTAPEAALYNRFTIKSDVWSFGILLYEIITHGRLPYTDLSNNVVLKQLKQGYRMPQPLGCPKLLHNIMLECWLEDPLTRPTFDTLQLQLKEFFTTEDDDYHELVVPNKHY